MKKLYLHIGHYKTGTSAVQKYCSEHAEDLQVHGYFYPPTSRPSNNPTNHGELSLTLAAKHGFIPPPWYSTDKTNIEDIYSAFIESAQSAEQDTILISSEEFLQLALRENSKAAIEELRDRLSSFDVTVLLYIREPMALLKSWYNELNKGAHGTRNFTVFFRSLNSDFLGQYSVYQKFSDTFGPDHVIVKTYKDTGRAHIQEFFRDIGCDLVPSEDGDQRIQEAQDISALELARLLKRRAQNTDNNTLSEFKSVEELERRVAMINEDFAQVSAVSDAPVDSGLSLFSIFSHLQSLIQPLVAHKCINPKEAEILRDAALKVEKYDLELAALLMGIAKLIRPEGPFINRKLQEYEAQLTETKGHGTS